LYFLVLLLYCPVLVATHHNRPARKSHLVRPEPTPRAWRIVRALLLFIALVLVVDGVVGDRGLVATRRARRQYDELANSIALQRAENARLREQARLLAEDPATIEAIARRRLGLIRPGEKVFIVKDPSQQTRP